MSLPKLHPVRLNDLIRLRRDGERLSGRELVRVATVTHVLPLLGSVGIAITVAFWNEPYLADTASRVTSILAILITLVTPIFYVLFRDVRAIGVMLVLAMVAVLTGGSFAADGIRAPQVIVLAQMPLWAALFDGKRGAIVTMVMVYAALGFLYFSVDAGAISNIAHVSNLFDVALIVACVANGTVIIIVVVNDYVERDLEKERRQAFKANRAKSDFLTSMSHELRTPLNAIIGFAQMLKVYDPETQRREVADASDQVMHAGMHLLGMIEDLLDLTTLEAGRMNFDLERLPPETVFDEALPLIRHMAVSRDISLIDKGNADAILEIDRKRLRQALVNLLSNAIKYNRPGGWVAYGSRLAESGAVQFFVADNGIGIATESQDQVFHQFRRLHMSEHSAEGVGIGLYFTKQLVEAMGGRVWFDSTDGEGSCFYLEFPVAAEAGPRITGQIRAGAGAITRNTAA